jgi:hypothetical protein
MCVRRLWASLGAKFGQKFVQPHAAATAVVYTPHRVKRRGTHPTEPPTWVP